MRILYSAILFLIISCSVKAQYPHFDLSINEELNGYISNEWVADIIFSEELNQLIVAGHINFDSIGFTPTQTVAYIMDIDGTFIKHKYAVGSTAFMAFQVIELETGFLYLGRYDQQAPFSGADYFILETDFEGNMLDLDIYGKPGILPDDHNNEARKHSVLSPFDNTVLSAGYRFTENGLIEDLVIWINKIDLDADSIIWETIIDREGLGDYALDMRYNSSDSTYIILAERYQFGTTYPITQYTEFIKVDEEGNIVEQSQAMFPTDDGTRDSREMVIDENGNIIVAGFTLQDGATIKKFDSNYDLVWAKDFNPHDSFTLFKNIRVSVDGHYIVSGNLNTFVSSDSIVDISGLVVKYHSETGDVIWSREIAHQYEDSNIQAWHNYIEAMTILPGGCIVLGGYVFYPLGSDLPQAAWMKLLDPNGLEMLYCTLPTHTEDIIQELSLASTVYPNPVSDVLFIDNLKNYKNYKIINMNGQSVQTGAIEKSISLSFYQTGLFSIVLDGKETIHFVRVE